MGEAEFNKNNGRTLNIVTTDWVEPYFPERLNQLYVSKLIT